MNAAGNIAKSADDPRSEVDVQLGIVFADNKSDRRKGICGVKKNKGAVVNVHRIGDCQLRCRG